MNESKADQEVEEAIRMIGAAPGVQPKLYFRTRNLPWYGKMFRDFSTVWKKCFHSMENFHAAAKRRDRQETKGIVPEGIFAYFLGLPLDKRPNECFYVEKH